MSKFIIVDKDKSGNKKGERYTVTYQIEDTDCERHTVDLYCISSSPVRYCYISGKYGVGLNTDKDRDEFLNEFYKFQKGGSYRKLNPIKYKKSELIQQQINEQEDLLYTLKKELDEAKQLERKEKFKNYYNDVDIDGLNKYVDKIQKAFSSERYYVSGIEFNIWEGHRLFIYDKDLNKAVKIITIRDDVIKVRDLDENDMKE